MNNIDARVMRVTDYILTNKATVRQTASALNMSKSTVWNDAVVKLPRINKSLSKSVNKLFDKHKAIRHIHGGQRTRELYKGKPLTARLYYSTPSKEAL